MHGFKEIRYASESMLDFIEKAFPSARFVVNYRQNVTAQSASAWYKDSPESADILETETRTLLSWASRNQNRTFLLPLETFSVESFNELFKWLGYPQCSAQRIPTDNSKGSYTQTTEDPPELVLCS